MTDIDITSQTPRTEAPGEHLVRELLWIHSILRNDLAITRRLAQDVLDGRDAQSIREELARLQSKSPLWQLKVSCIYYCRVVHAHHNGEDAHIFPALRRSSTEMGPVVDRLEADHRKVSDILDEVDIAARALADEDAPAGRNRLVEALNLLSDHLLAHLAYEEESISPVLRTWRTWPFY
ncbi:MAG TPA: hemerythrin domain-containing protein [Chloroflexota bacterium]|nr:hemerythrin domain-containing protein [Chloroflexota bacterium]